MADSLSMQTAELEVKDLTQGQAAGSDACSLVSALSYCVIGPSEELEKIPQIASRPLDESNVIRPADQHRTRSTKRNC